MRHPRSSLLALAAAIALVVFVPTLATAAEAFHGTFTVPNQVGGVMKLTLARSGSSATGTLDSNDVTMRLQGTIEDDVMTGTLTGPAGTLFFEAVTFENELWLTLYGTDSQGQPNLDDATEIDFTREGTAPIPAPGRDQGQNAEAAPDAGGVNPLSGRANGDPYVGTFSDGNVTLQLAGQGGRYRGQVTTGGVSYPVQAQTGFQGLEGLIEAPDGQYPIAAVAQGDGLFVVSGGMQYRLVRQTGAADGAAGTGAMPDPQAGSGAPEGAGTTNAKRNLAPGFTEDHPQVREWVQFLSGKKLTRMSSYSSGSAGGYSARTDLYLCSDRRFSLRDESSVSVDVGGAFGNTGGVEGGQGRWYVITNGQVVGLILEHANGQVDEVRMDYQDQKTFANGERVYVTPAEVCM